MLKLSLDDLKVDFLRTVYESITKQIQQTDLKMSILLTWNGAMAAVFGRYLGDMFRTRLGSWWVWILAAATLGTMVYTGINVYAVLKPRGGKGPKVEGFSGLLYAGDIQNLGKNAPERVMEYNRALIELPDHAAIYDQFARSIINISEIQLRKNRYFIRALGTTVTSFVMLIALMAVLGGILPVS